MSAAVAAVSYFWHRRNRQSSPATRRASSLSSAPTGCRLSTIPASNVTHSFSHSPGMTTAAAVSPCRTALRLTTIFPRTVRGPVDTTAFRRFASSFAIVVIGRCPSWKTAE